MQEDKLICLNGERILFTQGEKLVNLYAVYLF